MKQVNTIPNPETDHGYYWPQIGCLIGDLVELQVGFSCTHPRADAWEEAAKKQIEHFYGPEVLGIVVSRLDKMYADDETGENMIEEIPAIIARVIPMCDWYECEMVLL